MLLFTYFIEFFRFRARAAAVSARIEDGALCAAERDAALRGLLLADDVARPQAGAGLVGVAA